VSYSLCTSLWRSSGADELVDLSDFDSTLGHSAVFSALNLGGIE